MFARAARAEIGARHQNFGAFVLRLIEDEGRIFLAVGVKAPIEKKPAPESASHHRFQKLFGNYLVGIDIGAIERCDQSGKICKRFHIRYSPRLRIYPSAWPSAGCRRNAPPPPPPPPSRVR